MQIICISAMMKVRLFTPSFAKIFKFYNLFIRDNLLFYFIFNNNYPPPATRKFMKGKCFLNKEILVALVSMLGTVIGTFGGILTSSKLTSYRLEQLEKKVDRHNNFAARIPIIEEQIKVINHRIYDIEKEAHNRENH